MKFDGAQVVFLKWKYNVNMIQVYKVHITVISLCLVIEDGKLGIREVSF